MPQAFKAEHEVHLKFADLKVKEGEVVYVDFESGKVTIRDQEYEGEARKIRACVLQGWFTPDGPGAPKGTILRVLEDSIRG